MNRALDCTFCVAMGGACTISVGDISDFDNDKSAMSVDHAVVASLKSSKVKAEEAESRKDN